MLMAHQNFLIWKCDRLARFCSIIDALGDPDKSRCILPAGQGAYDVCDKLGDQCSGVQLSDKRDIVVLKGPFNELNRLSHMWSFCAKPKALQDLADQADSVVGR